MLTIQPNVSAKPIRQIAFKSNDNPFDYETQISYYKSKIDECDEFVKDDNSPGFLKGMMKFFKVLFCAAVAGLSVSYGAKKGAEFTKSTFIKASKTKLTQGAIKFVTPVFNKTKTIGTKLIEKAGAGIEKLQNTKFMKENAIGKIISKGITKIGDAAKFVGEKISKRITTPLKETGASKVYDKVANVTGKGLGIGAGAAGAYNAATDADKRPLNTVDNQASEYDEFDDEEEWFGRS